MDHFTEKGEQELRVLFLSAWFPFPPDNGSKLRIYNLLRGLAQRHELTLLAFADRPETDLDLEPLCSLCKRIRVIPNKVFNPDSLRARLGYLSLTPRSSIDTFSSEMASTIEQALNEEAYDVIIASEYRMAVYGQYLTGMPALLEDIELGVLFEQYRHATSVRNRVRHGLTWAKHRSHLARILKHYKVCTVVSQEEKELLSQITSNNMEIGVIPNCVNMAEYAAVDEDVKQATLIFTGSFGYEPNYEAMLWFLGNAYPHIKTEIPEVQLTITGNHLNKRLPDPHGVRLTGFVPDVRPYVARSTVSLAPIQTGGGTRLKILEAMALKTPVVATSKGAEGIEAKNGEHILIADSPQEFAQAVVKLVREPDLRATIANNAYRLVADKYDWERVLPRFLDLVDRAAGTCGMRDPESVTSSTLA